MSKSVRKSRKHHKNRSSRAPVSRPAAPQHVRPRPGPTARRRKRRQSRARRRAAVYMPGMGQEQHQGTTRSRRNFGFLSEPGGKLSSLTSAQIFTFPHKVCNVALQALRLSGIKISRHRGGTGYSIMLLTHLLYSS